MKKYLLLLLSALLLFLLASPAWADDAGASISRLQAVSQVMDALYNGACPAGESFDLDQHYCIHAAGHTHFVPDGDFYPVLCAVFHSAAAPGFKDIKSPNNRITLAKAMGIIKGRTDGSFHPGDDLTCNQAYAILTAAFYGNWIQIQDGYPADYWDAAKRAGFFQEGLQGEKAISSQDFQKMLAFCLEQTQNNVRNTIFKRPATADQCVADYAKAVQNRNGMLQYALLSDDLQKSLQQDFLSMGWVTGFSSPWVDKFTIKKLDDKNPDSLTYEIIFSWKTSKEPAFDSHLYLKIAKVDLGTTKTYAIKALGDNLEALK